MQEDIWGGGGCCFKELITNTIVIGCVLSGCSKSFPCDEETQQTLSQQLLTILILEQKNPFCMVFTSVRFLLQL